LTGFFHLKEASMTALSSLWLPILLSAVAVFIASSIIHMALPWHRNDYPQLPNEDQVLDALRPLNLQPGDYMVPRASSMESMRSPEFIAKYERGPVVVMTVLPQRKLTMTPQLIRWFLYSVVVSLFAGYVASRALGPGAEYLDVFRFAGTTAFAGYALALWQVWIWYGRSARITATSTFDGLIYALLTAGVFGWLWPR
jgi:hypothetical protein